MVSLGETATWITAVTNDSALTMEPSALSYKPRLMNSWASSRINWWADGEPWATVLRGRAGGRPAGHSIDVKVLSTKQISPGSPESQHTIT